MKKIGIVSVALATVMTAGVLSACGGPKEHYDMETSPFMMGLQTPDGVFNPFFSTSMYDSNVISWTQIGMLNTDKLGNIVCGDNEMCAVKNYASKYDPKEENGDDPKKYPGVTTYQLALKNGLKFSDGEDLTIKDVLFNLYTYLDINYTGSSTIYSTKILGLEAYRQDDPLADSSSLSSFEQRFATEAQTRVDNLTLYVHDHSTYVDSSEKVTNWGDAEHANLVDTVKADFLTVKEEFWKELNTDWNNTVAGMETYYKQNFTEAWQVFLWQDGGANELLEKDAQGNYVKNADGNYVFDADGDEANSRAELLADYLEENSGTKTKDELTKQWALESVFGNYFPDTTYDDEENIDAQILAVPYSEFVLLVNYSASSETILTKFAAQAKEAYFNNKGGSRRVKTISGITTFKADTIEGDDGPIDLGEECDILQIKVKGVDPKAIYNFSFLVAPLHYYSGTLDGVNYIENFNGDVASNPATADTVTNAFFGLKPASSEFMEKVINAPSKVGLPVGAGPYMASSNSKRPAASSGEFYELNHIYYERNPYFYTVLRAKGEGDTDEVKAKYNAKIKFMQYFVVPADQYITNLQAKELDYADPSAGRENIKTLGSSSAKKSGISYETVQTAGYGYIGINPRYVPNINIRRAIMKAFNTSIIFSNYYPDDTATPIYRSMSRANWAYPDEEHGGETVYKAKRGVNSAWDGSYSFDALGNTIEAIVQAEGYTKVNGVYQKEVAGFTGKNGNVDRLDYTFTIAGASQDHPAYNVFTRARTLLNAHGFDIKVTTSQTALSDLTQGKLAVWAAAWTSTVDPDMYQVYHKDSTATSVNNWGYPYIKKNAQGLYDTELRIVNELSNKIDEGRRYTAHDTRSDIYAEALDLVMELAVEFPTYQRVDLFAFNSKKLKRSSMPKKEDLGAYNSLLARIWEVEYN